MEIKITASNFEAEVLQADKPVLIDFWAEWCGPCRKLAPAVAEIAEEYADHVKVGKVNVDEEPSLAAQFGIVSIPTLILVSGGKIQAKSVGLQPKKKIEEMLG